MRLDNHFPYQSTKQLTIGLLGVGVLILSLSLQAQPSPDAGTFQQQIDRERGVPLPKKFTPIEVAPQPLQSLAGQTVTVKSFVFTGNTLLTSAQLAPVVAGYLNRPLSFAELQQAVAAVAAAYRTAGWIVRAYLPAQDIVDGVITIQIVEAVFGGVKIDGNLPKRVTETQIKSGFAARQAKGAALNANTLDRALLLADDLPGVAVSGSLQAGADAGETDLILKLADEPLVVGEIGADNTGARSTGSNRITANLNLNSPFGLADLMSGNVIHSGGSDYLRLAYSLPVGADGWRVGANTSALAYKLVAAEFEAMNAKGTSSTLGLDANYPIIRSRLKNLYLGLNYDNKRFNNEASQATSSNYAIDNYSIALNGNLFDTLGGGGANSLGLTLSGGRVNLGSLDTQENAALDGGFSKLRYSLSRQQVITDNLSFFSALTGQETANQTLDSSEKFYLGGASGVRAYPASEGGGSRGKLLNLEIRQHLPRGFNLTGFYDYGEVGNFDNSPSYSLKGVGAALAWQADFGLNLKATWAHRLGENPNPTATNGNDQDGSLIRERIWLVASLALDLPQATPVRSPAPAADVGKTAAAAPAPAVVADKTPEHSAPQASSLATAAAVVATTSDINAATAPAPVEAKSAAPDVANIAIVQHYREHPVLVSGFDANAAHLSAATQASLAEVAKAALLANTDRIEINGHTDHVGRATFNLKLSQKRANAAKTYLVKQGVAADRITAVGYGYSKPIASNATEQGRSLNRRIDVKLIQK